MRERPVRPPAGRCAAQLVDLWCCRESLHEAEIVAAAAAASEDVKNLYIPLPMVEGGDGGGGGRK